MEGKQEVDAEEMMKEQEADGEQMVVHTFVDHCSHRKKSKKSNSSHVKDSYDKGSLETKTDLLKRVLLMVPEMLETVEKERHSRLFHQEISCR